MANALIQNTETQANSADLIMQAMNISSNATTKEETSKFSNIINNLDARTQKAQNNFEQKAKVTNTSSINKKALEKKEITQPIVDKKTDKNTNATTEKDIKIKPKEIQKENQSTNNNVEIATSTTKETKNVDEKEIITPKETKETDNSQNLSDINNSSPVESSPVFSSKENVVEKETSDAEIKTTLEEIEKNIEDIINTIVTAQNAINSEKPNVTLEDFSIQNIETKEDLDIVVEEITNFLDNSDLNQETKEEIINSLKNIKESFNTENIEKIETDFKNLLSDLKETIGELIEKPDTNKKLENNKEIKIETSSSNKEEEEITLDKKELKEETKTTSIKENLDEIIKNSKEIISEIKDTIKNIDNEKLDEVVEKVSKLVEEINSNDEIKENFVNLNSKEKINEALENLKNLLKEDLKIVEDTDDLNIQSENKNVIEADFDKIELNNENSITLENVDTKDFEKIEVQDKKSMNEILNILKDIQENFELKQDTSIDEDTKIQIEELIQKISENKISTQDLTQALDELNEEVKVQIEENETISIKENSTNTIDLASEFEKNSQNQTKNSNNENSFNLEEQNQDIKLNQNELQNIETDFDFQEVNLKGSATKNIDIKNVEQNLQKAVAMQEMLDEMMVEVDIKTIPSNSGALSVADEIAKFAIGENNSLSSSTPIQNSVTYDSTGVGAVIKNASNLMKTAQTQTISQNPSMEDILNQVTNKITQLKDGATQKLTMVLRPNDLGRLSIELSTNQNGLTTHIMAQNEDVRAYIERNIDSLRQQLTDAGVNVNNIQIKTAGQEGSTNYEGNQNFNRESQQENLNQEQGNKDNKNNQQNHTNKNAKDVLASMSNYDMHFAKDFSSILNKSLNYNMN